MIVRVLVVDDSPLYRIAVSEILRRQPGVEVIGCAPDGIVALDLVRKLKPDLVTLDLEMPRLGGLDCLRRLPRACGVLILAAASADSASATMRALALGAFDFVVKPTGTAGGDDRLVLERRLTSALAAFRMSRAAIGAESIAAPAPLATRVPRVVLVGASTGGPEALTAFLGQLPAGLGIPILVAQHMPALFTRSLAEDLDRRMPFPVREARGGEALRGGGVLIAPGGRHMRVRVCAPKEGVIELSSAPQPQGAGPSVDELFRSAAAVFGGDCLGVILTGMGDDGLRGAEAIAAAGGSILAQDSASSVVYGMPRAVVAAGLASATGSPATLGALAGAALPARRTA